MFSLGVLQRAVAVVLVTVAGVSTAVAANVADFYRGKTVSIIVGFGAGGGFDLYARLVADNLGRHIPGAPAIIVQNMPGAGSMKAANYVYNAAPKNGTVLGSFLNNIPLNALLKPNAAKYNPAKYHWLGRVDNTPLFGLVWRTVPVKSVEEVKSREVVLASTGATSMNAVVPWTLNRVLGTKFKVVSGYKSSAASALAIERGETDGLGATSWQFLKVRKPEWIRENKVTLLYVSDLTRHSAFPNVPTIVELAKDEEARGVLRLLASSAAIGRSYVAAPGTPQARARALRTAFSAMFEDPKFRADAKKRKLDISPMSGEALEELVAEIVAAPKAVVERTKEATSPPKE